MNFCLLASLSAEIQLDPIYSNNMLLQRDARIPIRGSATTEEIVQLSFKGKQYTSQVSDGRWEIMLRPSPARALHSMTLKGSSTDKAQDFVEWDDKFKNYNFR